MSHDEENHEPSWMDSEKDADHRAIIVDEEEPLIAPVSAASSLGDEEKGTGLDYGSMNTLEDETSSKKSSGPTSGEKTILFQHAEGPRRNCLLSAFNFVEVFGVVASVALLTTQVVPLFFIPLGDVGLTNLVLKFYISIFCVLFIFVEIEAPMPFLKNSSIMQNYFSRGFVYSFLGVSALQEAYGERVNDALEHVDEFHVSWLGLFMQVAAWMMFVLGCMYMLFSFCCLKRLRDKLKEDYQNKWKEFRTAKRNAKLGH